MRSVGGSVYLNGGMRRQRTPCRSWYSTTRRTSLIPFVGSTIIAGNIFLGNLWCASPTHCACSACMMLTTAAPTPNEAASVTGQV